MKRAALVFNELDMIDRKLPGAEIQTLSFEILLEKAEKLNLLHQLALPTEYGAYRQKAKKDCEFVRLS